MDSKLGLPDGEQMLMIAKKVQQAKAEERDRVLAMVEERIRVYRDPNISDIFKVAWEHRAKALEELKTRLEADDD